MKTLPLPTSVLESLEPRLAPAGVVNITVAGGVLTLTGDSDANQIEVFDLGGGRWRIEDSTLGTQFSVFGGAPGAGVTLDAVNSIKANLGDGGDTLNLRDLEMRGTVAVLGGAGADVLTIERCNTLGALSFDGGSDGNTLTVRDGFHAGLTFKGGTATDSVTFFDSSFSRPVSLNFGVGSSNFNMIGDNTIQGNLSLIAMGNSGAAHNYAMDSGINSILGSVTFKLTEGTLNFTAGLLLGDSLRITGGLTVNAGAGPDAVLLTREISVGGAFALNLGNGTNSTSCLDLVSLAVGSFSYKGGLNTDNVDLVASRFTALKGVTVSAGDDVNVISFNVTGTTYIGGAVNLTGGRDIDNFQINGNLTVVKGAINFKLGNGSNSASFSPTEGQAGSVSYIGGTGLDSLTVGLPVWLTNPITIFGNVTSSMGTGQSESLINDAVVHGNVTHTSNVSAGVADLLFIRNSVIQGTTTVNMTGAANSLVHVNDSVFNKAFSASTGLGADSVFLDTDNVNNIRYSLFKGPVKILLGAGDDTFQSGDVSTTIFLGSDFRSSVLIDGGLGIDNAALLDPVYNNFFTSAPNIVNVETVI
ncbi:MAG: hypothetical protein V4599_07180 [Verrucomicrobiota bacterium]